ncbi:uncharacterized protein V1516DRAFT_673069 [Lipomyces oligophaga]|uniref:uncharacterized protein n=1 Tax=Lipomyces oligophaga TaxID=45792 RepID=UPI0034CF581A
MTILRRLHLKSALERAKQMFAQLGKNKRYLNLLLASIALLFFIPVFLNVGPNKTASLMSLMHSDPSSARAPKHAPYPGIGPSRPDAPPPSLGHDRHHSPPPRFDPAGSPIQHSTEVVDFAYAEGAEDVMLMVKTGATVLWKRLPIHFGTTFQQVPYYQVYSDMEETIFGHKVVDSLQNVSDTLKATEPFELYRVQQELLSSHANTEPQDHYGINSGKLGWDLDKYKNIPMIQHAWSINPNAKWYIFMDADSYVIWNQLLHYLRTLNYRHALYLGSPVGNPPIQFGHGGSVVVISRGAMLRSWANDPELHLKYEQATIRRCCGDYMVAELLYEHGVQIAKSEHEYPYSKWKFQGEAPHFIYANKENWCAPIMSFHHISPHDINKVHDFALRWSQNHAPNDYIRYVDVYHEFMHPWIEEEKDEWDNRSNDREYSPDRPKALRDDAYESKEKCISYCNAWDECLGWRYSTNFCALTKSVRLGRRKVRFGDDVFDESKRTISGWRIDRIRVIRAQSGCDPLAQDELVEGINDSGIVPGLEVN